MANEHIVYINRNEDIVYTNSGTISQFKFRYYEKLGINMMKS